MQEKNRIENVANQYPQHGYAVWKGRGESLSSQKVIKIMREVLGWDVSVSLITMITRGRIQRKTWCMGPCAGVDLTLGPLQGRIQHIYHGQPDATVDLNRMPEIPQNRLCPPVRNFGFGLCCATSRLNCTGLEYICWTTMWGKGWGGSVCSCMY